VWMLVSRVSILIRFTERVAREVTRS
jgi:hypothetical protein